MENGNLHGRKWDYSWVIIGLCFLVIFTGMGFCSSGRAMYLTAITDALDLSRGAFSVSNSLRYITTTILNLFFGRLVGRFGTKKLLCAGFVCLIGFALLNSVATELLTFYIGGVLLGMGISWTGTTMVSTVVNKWCRKNKATVSGIVLAANGIGGATATQVLSPIIFREGDPFGYRTSYRLVAVLLTVVLVLLLIFFRDAPKGDTEKTVVSKKRKVRGAGWVGMEYNEVIRKPYFYVALGSMFLTGMVLQGLAGITQPHMYDMGMDVAFVAATASISGILLTFSKFMTGWMYDRFGIRLSMNLALFSAFVSMMLLIVLDNTPLGRVLAFVRLPFHCIALPLETVMLPIFASEFFGNKPFERLIGLFVAASAAGFAVGETFANTCFDIFGDYKLAFAVFAALMAVSTAALQYVLWAANRDKKRILDALQATADRQ